MSHLLKLAKEHALAAQYKRGEPKRKILEDFLKQLPSTYRLTLNEDDPTDPYIEVEGIKLHVISWEHTPNDLFLVADFGQMVEYAKYRLGGKQIKYKKPYKKQNYGPIKSIGDLYKPLLDAQEYWDYMNPGG